MEVLEMLILDEAWLLPGETFIEDQNHPVLMNGIMGRAGFRQQ